MTTEAKVTHTPGPWRVVKQLRFDENVLVLAGDSKVIAEVWHSTHLDCNPDVDLIAAAPEMLKELEFAQSMIDAVMRNANPTTSEIHDALSRLARIIAKAKGGAA